MGDKLVKLSHVEKLIDLVNTRDKYNSWSPTWDILNKKVENTIEFIKRNAVEVPKEEIKEVTEETEEITLGEFIQKYVCRNSVVRLWKESNKEGICHELVQEVRMEWQILKENIYTRCPVIGITDILTETTREAINIVIKGEEDNE